MFLLFTNPQRKIKLVLFVLFLISVYHAASTAPTWSTNSDIQAGVVTICSGKAYLSGTGPYTRAYSPAFSVAPNVGVAISTIDISPTPTSMDWKVNLPDSANTATLKISMNYISTQFQTFKVAYISVASTLSYLKVDYVELTFATGIATGTGGRLVQSNFNLHITIDSTHTLSIIPYLSGLKIATTSGDYSFGLTFAKNTNTNVLYNATVQGTTKVTEIVSYVLIYDLTLGEAGQELFLDYQPLTGSNNALSPANLLYFNSNNLLAGVSQFSFTTGFSFALDPTSLTLSRPTPTASFTSIQFSFWSFRKRTCTSPTVYYEKNTNLCYDVCPTGYLAVDSTTKYCESCSTYMPHCSGCTSSTVCTQCQTTFSVKSDHTGCQCAPGKYLNGAVCSSCQASCATCTGGTASNCLSCANANTFLSGTTCQLCDTSCKTCTGALSTQCASCNNGLFLSAGSCAACHASCKTCSGSSSQSCLSCLTDTKYVNSNNQCVTCPSACSTCSDATTCLTCPAGKYLSASHWCEDCYFSCSTCNGGLQTNCVTCDQVTRTFSAGKCVCKVGVEDAEGNCVTNCNDAGCLQCPSDPNVCTQCKPVFTLSGGRCHCPTTTYYSITDKACYICHQTCALCSGPSSTECTGCLASNNRVLNLATFSCDCSPTYYAPNSELVCIKSPSTTCPADFFYNDTSGYCQQTCGDGKLYQLQCDDGNLDPKDGCDPYCKIQTGFICLYGDQSSPSICSYDGQVIFSLVEAKKQMYANTIDMLYDLSPQIKFYEKFPNFTAYLTPSDPVFTITSATYSSSEKKLHLTLSYSQSIVSKTLSITYVPPSSPYSHALLSSSYSWSPAVSNSLSLSFYDEMTYSTGQTFDHLVLGLFIGSLIVFILSLFFRKMIGIQMIILVQTQVLSMVMLKEVHPYLASLLTDKFVFGYNGFEDLANVKKESGTSESNVIYRLIGFSQIFGQNINVMLFAVMFMYLVAIIVGLWSKCVQKSTSKKMKQAAIIVAREIAFGLVLFSILNITISYILEIGSGNIFAFSPEYSGLLKILAIILIIANYIVYAITYKQSVQSYVFYAKRSKLSQLQPLFIATKTILIAVGIGLYHRFGVATFYALMSLQGVYIVFVAILRPFKRKVDLARNIIVELALGYVFVVRFLLKEFVNLYDLRDWTTFIQYGIAMQYAMVGLALIMSFVCLVFHLVKANKADAQINPEELYYSQIDMMEKKLQNEKQDQIGLQSFLDKQISKKYSTAKSPRQKGLFSSSELKNNSSLGQLIQLSNDQDTASIGNDSKRKLNNKKSMGRSMEIIQMEED